jgi:hypothetical protein
VSPDAGRPSGLGGPMVLFYLLDFDTEFVAPHIPMRAKSGAFFAFGSASTKYKTFCGEFVKWVISLILPRVKPSA